MLPCSTNPEHSSLAQGTDTKQTNKTSEKKGGQTAGTVKIKGCPLFSILCGFFLHVLCFNIDLMS